MNLCQALKCSYWASECTARGGCVLNEDGLVYEIERLKKRVEYLEKQLETLNRRTYPQIKFR